MPRFSLITHSISQWWWCGRTCSSEWLRKQKVMEPDWEGPAPSGGQEPPASITPQRVLTPSSAPHPQLHDVHLYGRQWIAAQWWNVLGAHHLPRAYVPALASRLWGKATSTPSPSPPLVAHSGGSPKHTQTNSSSPSLLCFSWVCRYPRSRDWRNLILEHFHLHWLGFFSFLLLLLSGVSL